MRKLFFIIVIGLITLISCRNELSRTENQCRSFETTIKAQFDSVKINEVIKPMDFFPTQHYLAVLHKAQVGEDQLYVYSLDSLKFLYSFATKGNGPTETIALDLFRNSGDNDNVDLFDQSSYKRLSYALTDTGAVFLESSHVDLPNLGALQETWWVNDSVIVLSTIDGELMTFNVNNDSIIDVFKISDLFGGITDETDVRNLCDFQYSLRDNRLVIGLLSVNQLLMGRISNNKIELVQPDGALLTVPESMNMMYYTFIAQTDSLILAQYYGKPKQYIPKQGSELPDFTQEIGCFDANLNPKYVILPEMQTPRFYVDPNHNRILCWDQTSDFNYIYTFPIPN